MKIFKIFFVLFIPFYTTSGRKHLQHHIRCGGHIRESRGVITTPNFPNAYNVPIACRWVIEAPSNKVIVVYFTQLYMRDGLQASEYTYYSHNVQMDKHDFGIISSEQEPTYLVSNKPVLVLDFAVKDLINIHMRVREFLLDVFGFNITYEMIARNESVRKDACIYHHCSFNGDCYASSEYDRYYCSCYSEYFGDECQYDPDCGPTATRNMCQNGGICRYYIGSTVRTCECPSGFDGARCDVIKPSVFETISPNKDGRCRSLVTTALPGYHSHYPPEEMCAKPGEMRIVISLKIDINRKGSNEFSGRKIEQTKQDIKNILERLLLSRFPNIRNVTVLSIRINGTMTSHFFGEDVDRAQVKSLVKELAMILKQQNVTIHPNSLHIHSEPALRIEKIEVSEVMPTVEGIPLVLACIVQGSNSLRVEWLKDGSPIFFHVPHRRIWKLTVPKNSQQQYTALLGFDKTHVLDTGDFTCKVRDWGFIQNITVHVVVRSAPQPQLIPMSLTIRRGDQLIITCLSREDIYGNFGYTWFKNGRLLSPSMESEMIEDLFPAGSRILLRSAKSSANYTCIITNSAGSTKRESVITVLEKESHRICLAEEYMRVKWSMTASDTDDIQLCPSGYTGYAKRRCKISKFNHLEWEEPDFADCWTSGLAVIKKQFVSLQMGYLQYSMSDLLNQVLRYLTDRMRKMHISEGEPIVDLLEIAEGIGDVERDEERDWQVIMNISSLLLGTAVIRKPEQLVKLHHLITVISANYGQQFLETSSVRTFYSNSIIVEIAKVRMDSIEKLKFPLQRKGSSHRSNISRKDSSWLQDTVKMNLVLRVAEEKTKEENTSLTIVVVFYNNFSINWHPILSSHDIPSPLEINFFSRFNSVTVKSESEFNVSNLQVEINFNHLMSTPKHNRPWNISCAVADVTKKDAHFKLDLCHRLMRRNHSICHCLGQGTFALLLVAENDSKSVHFLQRFQVVAVVGCFICIILVFFTLFALLLFLKRTVRAVTSVKLQVCVAVIATYSIFVMALSTPGCEEFYPYMSSLLQFFFLAAHLFQPCLALMVYLECQNIRTSIHPNMITTLIGWGAPGGIVGSTAAAKLFFQFLSERWWWLKFKMMDFYIFVSSILLICALEGILLVLVKTEILRQGRIDLNQKKEHSWIKKTGLLHRSVAIHISLLLATTSSIILVNFNHYAFECLFCITSVLLATTISTSYVFYSEKYSCLHCSHHRENEATSVF